MKESALSITRNLFHLANKYGFIPNGNRVYYLYRTQPPVLAAIVHALISIVEDHAEWLREALPALEKEYNAYRSCRRAGTDRHLASLSVYRVANNTLRPESYKEDYETALRAPLRKEEIFYRHLAGAAESRWDFSSRWLPKGIDLEHIRTDDIIPVCLNALLLRTER